MLWIALLLTSAIVYTDYISMRKISTLGLCILGCQLVGILGSFFTVSAIQSWYVTLSKPFFSPPNWVFGPVWTFLYLCMGIALYILIQQGIKKNSVRRALQVFFLQLFANFLWSPVFFGLRSPELGILVIFALWILIVITLKRVYRVSIVAFALLVPYFLWVSFASVLNVSIAILN